MTWGIILSIVLFSVFKLVVTCLPTDTVNALLGRYEAHSKLDSKNTTISYNGKILDEMQKEEFITTLNESVLREKYYIWPGTEDSYLKPEDGVVPLVVDAKGGKHNFELYVFQYSDRIDVVKKSKKKLIAYSLFSDNWGRFTASI